MKELAELRSKLIVAEFEYKVAQGSLDSSPLQVVVAKETLRQARYNYALACRDYVEQTIFNESLENDQ
jgi:hypothetical protein